MSHYDKLCRCCKVSFTLLFFYSMPSTIAGISLSPLVVAQETNIAPLVISARKREENLQEVPFSVQVLSDQQIHELSAPDLQALSRSVASFSVQNLGPGQSQVAIRGISAGQIARDQPGVKEQVGTYLDESVVSLSLFTPELDFYDMERVEVLRGPQGTLFGSGSLSGTVRYISREPRLDEFRATLEAGANAVTDGGLGGDLKGMANIVLTDKAALRLVGYSTNYPGFIDAVQPDGEINEDVNVGERYGMRASLLLQPSPYLKILPRIVHQSTDINGFNREDDFNILANEFTTTRDAVTLGDYQQFTQLEEKFSDRFSLADLKIEWELRGAYLTSITSWTERDISVVRDETSLLASIAGGSIGWPESVYTLDAPLFDNTVTESLTQEIRLSSKGNGRVEWVGGVFYSDNHRHYSQSYIANGFEAAAAATGLSVFQVFDRSTAGVLSDTDELFFSDIPYNTQQAGLFGEIDVAMSEKLSITAGLRWFDFKESRMLFWDGVLADQVVLGQEDSTSSRGFSPRVMAKYTLSADASLNVQVSKGFRLGGINDPLNMGVCNQGDLNTFGDFPIRFDDEEVLNFEIGSKIALLNGLGSFNISAFYSQIENLQATVDAQSCSSRIVVNVPEAISAGLEFAFFANFTDNLEVALTGSYIDSRLETSIRDSDDNILAGLEGGRKLPTAPDLQAAVSGTYYFDWSELIEGAATLSFQHVGERHTQTSDLDAGAGEVELFSNVGGIAAADGILRFNPILDAYNIANLRLTASAFRWKTSLFVNNLTNEKANLSLDRERGFTARQGFLVNQPRTYGVIVHYTF
ncbi:MAG: TonB-dependent receptor [Exilibacterium sp.]